MNESFYSSAYIFFGDAMDKVDVFICSAMPTKTYKRFFAGLE